MKIYKTIPETKAEQLESTTCDLCGDISYCQSPWASGCSIFKASIKMTDGQEWEDRGCDTEISYDVCPDCFKNKLVPWFDSYNVAKERG